MHHKSRGWISLQYMSLNGNNYYLYLRVLHGRWYPDCTWTLTFKISRASCSGRPFQNYAEHTVPQYTCACRYSLPSHAKANLMRGHGGHDPFTTHRLLALCVWQCMRNRKHSRNFYACHNPFTLVCVRQWHVKWRRVPGNAPGSVS